MDIYIKPVKKAKLTGRRIVYLQDIAEVYYPGETGERFHHIIITQIEGEKRSSNLITIIDIVKAITKAVEGVTVVNLGAEDVIVEYDPKPPKNNRLFEYAKVFLVSMILFFGCACAIMSYNSDAQMSRVFHNFYTIFFNESVEVPYILHIPYAIGLALGIIVFFNHFSKAYVSHDPTPIEVQMTTYEKETIASVVDALERQNQQQGKNGS